MRKEKMSLSSGPISKTTESHCLIDVISFLPLYINLVGDLDQGKRG